jgi:hypothetical protein
MHGTASFYTIWSHRSAKSIFGASCRPVNRDGRILSFETEKEAQAECDRLNAGRSGSQVRYSIERANTLPLETGLAVLSDGFRLLTGGNINVSLSCGFASPILRRMVPPSRIELLTPSLPMTCSTTELRRLRKSTRGNL